MAEPSIIYKVAALRLIDRSTSALSNNQVCGFFTSRGYTDYFSIQQLLSDLEKTGQISASTSMNSTFYSLSEEGSRTLDAMGEKVSPPMEADILAYLAEIQVEVNLASGLEADYYKATGGGYLVHCRFTSDKQTKMDITLHAANEEMAKTIVNNWKARYEDVYACLLDTLM